MCRRDFARECYGNKSNRCLQICGNSNPRVSHNVKFSNGTNKDSSFEFQYEIKSFHFLTKIANSIDRQKRKTINSRKIHPRSSLQESIGTAIDG